MDRPLRGSNRLDVRACELFLLHEARMLDLGAGLVTAATYEYGNTFLMTTGLLNFLVILDAFDIAIGRK